MMGIWTTEKKEVCCQGKSPSGPIQDDSTPESTFIGTLSTIHTRQQQSCKRRFMTVVVASPGENYRQQVTGETLRDHES
jgi:hypothetical protein